MSEYRLAPAALSDLDEISAYIFEDNPVRSITFIDELIDRFDVIAERPLSFPASNDLPAGVRSALHGHYRILFEMTGSIQHILRVIHGARDIGNLLKGL